MIANINDKKIEINSNDQKNEFSKNEVGQLSLDIYQTDNEIVILAPIAGVNEKNLKVSITEDTLIIQGKRMLKEEIETEHYYTKECFWGEFSRAIVLPEDVDISKANATFVDNVLEIRIPKMAKEKTKIIKIKAS